LYNSLTTYIDKDKITSYNIFVEKSLSTIKKEDEIKTEIKDNKKEIEKKVSTIKNKIEENNKKQQEKLNNLLEEKIKNKLLKFKNSKKIESL
jgi:peptidoglycan hydrolase CwlO-like protein